jgi:hypothetical protein
MQVFGYIAAKTVDIRFPLNTQVTVLFNYPFFHNDIMGVVKQ